MEHWRKYFLFRLQMGKVSWHIVSSSFYFVRLPYKYAENMVQLLNLNGKQRNLVAGGKPLIGGVT